MSRLLFLLISGLTGAIWFFSLTSLFQFQPKMAEFCRPTMVEIYSEEGHLLQSLRSSTDKETGFSSYQQLKYFPDYLIRFLLLTEDKRFYDHLGIDPLAMLRTIKFNLSNRKIVSGASTITQQLARTLYADQLSNNRFIRKWQEIVLAIRISEQKSKQTVLECYLNKVSMPWFRSGIPAISQALYKKDISLLNKEESAILVLLIGHNTRNKKQLRVRMKLLAEVLNKDNVDQLPIFKRIINDDEFLLKGPDLHFAEWLSHRYPSITGKIETTIYYDLQGDVARILENELTTLKKYNVHNASVVVLEIPLKKEHNSKVYLRSLIGSENYFHGSWGQVNGAVALRDAGSTLKSFVYGLAFDSLHLRPYSLVDDEEISLGVPGGLYRASNSDQMFWGKMTLHEALANSRNIPVLKLVEKLGMPAVYNYFRQIGFDHLQNDASYYGPGLVLGIGGVSLLHLAQLYASLVNHGKLFPVYLGKHNTTDLFWGITNKTMTENSAYHLTDILSDQEIRRTLFGERNFLDFPFDVAVKTGTSKDHRDSWAVGYTSRYVVAVWAGNFTGEKTREVSGVFGAGRILQQVFRLLVTDRHEFIFPQDWQRLNLCRQTGKPAEKNCRSIAMRVPKTEMAGLLQNNEIEPYIISPIPGEKFYLMRKPDQSISTIPIIISVPEPKDYSYQIDEAAKQLVAVEKIHVVISLPKGKHAIKLYKKSELIAEHYFFVY